MNQRNVAAVLAEMFGTFVLVVVVLNIARYGLPFFTAIAAGATIATFVTVAARVGAGHFNPIVSLGLLAARRVSFLKAAAFIAAQFLGAVAAWKLVEWFTGQALENATKSGMDWKVFVGEMLGGFVFMAVVIAALSQDFSVRERGVVIGAGLFLGLTVTGMAVTTGGIVNPAVALGNRGFDWGETFAAPIIGGILGAVVVELLMARQVVRRGSVPAATSVKEVKSETKLAKVEEGSTVRRGRKPAAKKAPAKRKVVAKKKK